MRKFDKTKPHVQYIAMKKYKTMKTPVLCLKKVSLLRQQESDTDQDCARSRPWGWSARTHPPRYLSTSRISIITPSPLDISSRQCVLSCRPKIFMKRLKKAKCVRRCVSYILFCFNVLVVQHPSYGFQVVVGNSHCVVASGQCTSV